MSLKDKAARVSLENLDDDPPATGSAAQPDAASASSAPSVAAMVADGPQIARRARSGVAAISERIGVHQRVQDLEAKVAEYEEAGVIVRIDPKLVRENKWKNRHPLSYATQRYLELKTEIEGAGGNVQPIKVRRLEQPDVNGCEYEVVYGRRRLRACLELGLVVSAIVASMTDVEVFQAMERENRNREDLSPWEQGVMYKDAIDQGLFSSQRQMAAALGVEQSILSKAIRLASLPGELVDAFPSPLELQFRWGSDLADAFDKDPARILSIAEQVRRQEPRPVAKEVYARLIGATTVGESAATTREFSIGGKRAAAWTKDLKGNASLKIKPGVLSAAKERKLVEFLEKLFE